MLLPAEKSRLQWMSLMHPALRRPTVCEASG